MGRCNSKKAAGNHPEIQGNWEERGVVGPRIEIIGDRIVILWRGGPVLDTNFTTEEEADGTLLFKLAKNGLRYVNSPSDYASVGKMTYKDDRITMEELFPITGSSVTVFSRTENNRYGNYDILSDMFDWLKGSWTDESGYNNILFEKDTATINGEKIKIVVLKPRWAGNSELEIRDANASRGLPGGLASLKIKDGRLIGCIQVCDAPSIYLVFSKK
ncbi:MAG: hypothetical protein J5921_00320 [Clostridia bacterium]|nr:hypothetical protein [Clostridia bacterium]